MKLYARLAMPLLLAVLPAGAGPAAAAERTLLELDWSRLDVADLASSGGTVVETTRGWSALRIVYTGTGPTTIPLTRLTDPGITANQYRVSGQVRYEDVPGNSYLEMWNVLPGGARFFSRTLGTVGPMKALTGTSDWRPFLLPAFLHDAPERPSALEINLALYGPAVVEIGPLTLTEVAAGEGVGPGAPGAWWGRRAGALVGGLGGAGLGLTLALLGVLVGLGRARPLVTALAIALVAGGLLALILGLAALAASQPYTVYYPLLLLGGLTTALAVGLFLVASQRYRALELRRMRAIDVS